MLVSHTQPYPSTPTPGPVSDTSTDNSSATDTETADDVATVDAPDIGETANDAAGVEDGTNDGETADDSTVVPGR